MNSFTKLPLEIVYIILSFDGTIIKERNGKYMKQILRTDSRYEPLLQIPVKEKFFDWGYGAHMHVLFTRFTIENPNSGFLRMTMTEYYNCNRFIMNKKGSDLDDTRYIYK